MQSRFPSTAAVGAVLLELIWSVTADLPVHCVLRDVAGEWEFRVGPALPSAFADAKSTIPACGRHIPNTVTSMLTTDPAKEVPTDSKERFRVNLTEDILQKPFRHLHVAGGDNAESAAAGDIKAGGYWTMVFDEGFEMRSMNGRSFFSHFFFEAMPNASRAPKHGDRWNNIAQYYGRHPTKLQPKGDIYACHCDRLSVGWWHEHDKNGNLKSGCFWAQKVHKKAADEKDSISLIRWQGSRRKNALSTGSLRGSNQQGKLQAAPVALHRTVHGEDIMEVESFPVDEDMTTKKEVLVPTIHEMDRKIQQAGKTTHDTAQLNQLKSQLKTPVVVSAPATNSTNLVASSEFEGLPKSFDWRKEVEDMAPAGVDDLSEQFNQGNCGSCYAFSGTLVLQMRFRIQLFKKHGVLYPLELSWKSATRCSPYTEGCEGGFAYLTFKYAAEAGLPLADCDRKTKPQELDQTCDWSCYRNNPMLFYAKDYGQTGGFAHGSDEESIMREIHANGPVIVSFAASAIPEFIYNNGQSYKKETDVLTVIKKEKVAREPSSENKDILPWSYTTHSILAVGWGEETGPQGEILKYWVVRNSWGKDWGTQGYAKIRRGHNDAAIETSAPWVEPDMDRLPDGFLEMAKKYHDKQAAVRAKEATKGPATSTDTQAHKNKGGLPEYCKMRPDSPDCK
jgi:cathepsin C